MCDKIQGSAESTKAELHWQLLYKAKKGVMFSRDNTWTSAAKMGQEELYEMYVRPFHRELSLVGMRHTARLGAKRDFEVWTYDSDNSTRIKLGLAFYAR